MKYIKLIIFLLMPLFVISCDKPESLKKQYIEACADGNFDKARNAAQKLEAIDKSSAEEAIKYVNDKEIYYLLAKPSNDNDARILYLYNTYEENQLPNMKDVVEVAISMGDVSLAEKLIKAGVTPDNSAIIIAAVHADEQELVAIIIKNQPQTILNDEVAAYVNNELGKEFLYNIFTNICDNINKINQPEKGKFAELVLKYEMYDLLNQIIKEDYTIVTSNSNLLDNAKKTPNFSNIIAQQLRNAINEHKKSTPTFHSQSIVGYIEGREYADGYGLLSSEKHKMKMPSENRAIEEYNKKLMNIYGEALKFNRKDIALQALNEMKPKIEFYGGHATGERIKGFIVDGNHSLIYHNYDEINKLKSELR